MKFILDIVQIVVGLLLIASILLQAKGSGLGAAFGGSDNIVATRRGAEKSIFIISIILAIFFVGLGAARMFIV